MERVFTPRQYQVLILASQGETSKTTAEKLGIGIETVKDHRQSILRRLDARSIHQAVSMAYQKDLMP